MRQRQPYTLTYVRTCVMLFGSHYTIHTHMHTKRVLSRHEVNMRATVSSDKIFIFSVQKNSYDVYTHIHTHTEQQRAACYYFRNVSKSKRELIATT